MQTGVHVSIADCMDMLYSADCLSIGSRRQCRRCQRRAIGMYRIQSLRRIQRVHDAGYSERKYAESY